MSSIDDLKFSYYDIFSNIIPGVVFLWSLAYLGPLSNSLSSDFFTSNIIINSITFIILVYVLGLILQFISKNTVERLIRKIYWKNHFFSEIYLIDAFHKCSSTDLTRFKKSAEDKLGFRTDDLGLLSDPENLTNKEKQMRAMKLSQSIFRVIDAKTNDEGKAQKAHLHNVFYSLFRNLSAAFLIIGILDFAYVIYYMSDVVKFTGLALLNMVLFSIFFVRTKERGESYVTGLFWSHS